MTNASSVDNYIAGFQPPTSTMLKQLRRIIRQAAPQAEEKLSYGMPYYNLKGRLVYFAAHKDHIGLYPMKSGIKAFENELKNYHTSAGTIQFPLDTPLPEALIKKIIEFRVKENLKE